MALSPSQRVDLIREIGERLSNSNWSLIDVTLNQFGLKTGSWDGSAESYVLAYVKDAPDQTLIELAHHLGYKAKSQSATATAPVHVVTPGFWHGDRFHLFISHLAANRSFAGELQTALESYGISSFVAHNDIEPTQEWEDQIKLALSTCDALIALLHKGFDASKWTDQEIGFAMGRGAPAFAVRLGETPYGFIGRFQAFNGNGKTAEVLAQELFECFRKNKQTHRGMALALVDLLEDSRSFATAKERIGYLEQLTVWDLSFADRIEAASEYNDQIGGSWGVPERVHKLAIKWRKASAAIATS